MADPWNWFARRTLHHSRYADHAALARAKEERGRLVTVCLPTRNEADTVGGIVRCIREDLVEAVPLVDEIVVVDSGSTDGTAVIAADAGAVVHQDADIRPDLEPLGGKGDALWKSLFVTKGDRIAFVDSDIQEFDSRFVTGLLGPLLLEDSARFVKGFYERPIREGAELQPSGGGRVTELMARPLVSLLFPSLAGFVQPLSGEYAGTRELLESVPFFTGYGVDLGLLIDVVSKAGLDDVVQVDLERRIHRNHPVAELSRMAFGVLQVAFLRLESEGRMQLRDKLGRTLFQFRNTGQGYEPDPVSVRVVERPPAASVPGYRAAGGP